MVFLQIGVIYRRNWWEFETGLIVNYFVTYNFKPLFWLITITWGCFLEFSLTFLIAGLRHDREFKVNTGTLERASSLMPFAMPIHPLMNCCADSIPDFW